MQKQTWRDILGVMSSVRDAHGGISHGEEASEYRTGFYGHGPGTPTPFDMRELF